MTDSTDSCAASPFIYDQDIARKNLIKLIILRDLPFQMVEDPFFQYWVNDSFNPSFVSFTRNAAGNDVFKYYNEEKEKLKKMLLDCPGKISLTSEIWESNQGLKYLSISAKFIDKDWVLQKRCIVYTLLDESLMSKEIAEAIVGRLANDWGISDKIFSITMGNSCASFISIDRLKTLATGAGALPLGGGLFDVRCRGEILTLVVQHCLGVNEFKEMLERIRGNLEYIYVSDIRYSKFAEACETYGLNPKRLKLDVEDRWNSTYSMLNDVILYRQAIAMFYNSGASPHALTDDDWNYAEFLCKFLRLSRDATNCFSTVDSVTSAAVLKYLYEIGEMFSNYRTAPLFKGIVSAIEQKFVEYWGQTPTFVGLASVLDPRVKTKGLEIVSSELDRLFGDSVASIICYGIRSTSISSILKALLMDYYANKNKHMHASAPTSSSLLPDLPACSTSSSRKRSFWEVFRQNRSSGPLETTLEELNRYYLEPEPDNEEHENFNVLFWWKENEKRHPILSAIARDILTVPVSTVAPEWSFITGKHELDDDRSSLMPDMLECCMLLKGCWEAELGHLLLKIDPLNDDIFMPEDIVHD